MAEKKLTMKNRLPTQWIILGVILLTFGGLLALTLYIGYQRIEKREQERLFTQARVIEENLVWNLDSLNQVLADLKNQLPRMGNECDINQHLKILADAMPGVRTILLLDAQGTVRASSRPELVNRNFRQRDYFRVPSEHPDRDTLYISPPFKTALGAFLITAGRIVTGPDGKFAGVVTAALDPHYFKMLFSSVLYAPDMVAAIAHGDGIQFLMMPENETPVGKDLARPGTFFTLHRRSGQKTSMHTGTNGSTGEKTIQAWRTTQPAGLKMDKPLIVAVSRNRDAVYTLWHRQLMTQCGLFTLVALLALLGLYIRRKRQGEFRVQAAKSAAALKESAERLRLATSSASIGVWELDLASNRVTWNDSMYSMYGLPRETAIEHGTWLELVHPDDLARVELKLQKHLIEGIPLNDEFRIVRPDHHVRTLRAHAQVYYDESNKPLRVVGVSFDITEQKENECLLIEAKRQAEAANTAKSAFLANMSHEIRTPMNAVLGLTHLLQKTGLNPRQRDYCTKVQDAATSLLGILNDILDFSKVEAGRIELEQVPFDLDQLLKNLSDILSANSGHKDIEIIFDVAPDVPRKLVGDPLRLQQVLINLTGNAVKFTEQGEVGLSVSAADPVAGRVYLTISIHDTGIGIGKENLAQIFEGFTQAEASTSRRFGGSGLGLAISSRLVRLMGGEIEVVSEEGKGSTFSFSIGFALQTPEQQALPERPDPVPDPTSSDRDHQLFSLAGLRILVAEDNAFNQLIAKEILEGEGALVVIADNGLEAVKYLGSGEFCFDAVLMDVQMPVMDGYQATREIRNSGDETVPIIAMTANAFEGDRRKCIEAGMNDHLAKPINVEMLLDTLEKYCAPNRSKFSPGAGPDKNEDPNREEIEEFPGLDLPDAIRRLNGNYLLYCRMARMACTSYADVGRQIELLLSSGDTAAARQVLHTFKGVVASLGAFRLGACIGEFEEALMQGTATDNQGQQLSRTLDALWHEARNSLRGVIETHDQQAANQESIAVAVTGTCVR